MTTNASKTKRQRCPECGRRHRHSHKFWLQRTWPRRGAAFMRKTEEELERDAIERDAVAIPLGPKPDSAH